MTEERDRKWERKQEEGMTACIWRGISVTVPEWNIWSWTVKKYFFKLPHAKNDHYLQNESVILLQHNFKIASWRGVRKEYWGLLELTRNHFYSQLKWKMWNSLQNNLTLPHSSPPPLVFKVNLCSIEKFTGFTIGVFSPFIVSIQIHTEVVLEHSRAVLIYWKMYRGSLSPDTNVVPSSSSRIDTEITCCACLEVRDENLLTQFSSDHCPTRNFQESWLFKLMSFSFSGVFLSFSLVLKGFFGQAYTVQKPSFKNVLDLLRNYSGFGQPL